MSNTSTTAWFARILEHDSGLRMYLKKCFSDHVDVSEVMQETYARLLAFTPEQREAVRSLRAFLFVMACNVAKESLRRRPLVSLDALLDSLPDYDVSGILLESDSEPTPDETVNATQELELLARVIASLPDKCREVLTLRKIQGIPQKEIAMRLGIAEHTVEKHISYGLRLCAARMLEQTSIADGATDPPSGQRRTRGY